MPTATKFFYLFISYFVTFILSFSAVLVTALNFSRFHSLSAFASIPGQSQL